MECGEVYMLHELSALVSPWRKCVRVAGFVEWLDVRQKQCVIAHRGHNLRVDCALIDLSKLKPDSLCQLIGEIRQYSQQVSLRGTHGTAIIQTALLTTPLTRIGTER
jgi:hypothetical protein